MTWSLLTHLLNGCVNNTYIMGLLGFDETMHVKLLAQCLIYSKVSMSDIIIGYLLLFQVI